MGWLGGFFGNTPMNREAIQMLQRGNTADVRPFMRLFGIKPVGLAEWLSAHPAQRADRWYAALYFLRPALRLSIASLWILIAIVSVFVFPVEQSHDILARSGISDRLATIMLYAASVVDLLLGLATLLTYRIRLVGLLQIAVILLYTVIISLTQPELWTHPFGPISKNIPIIAAIAVMMALEKK